MTLDEMQEAMRRGEIGVRGKRSQFSIPLTRLIHENLSIVMSFAYSRKPLSHLMDAKFQGEWKYLNRALFEVSAERVEKACLELALFLRIWMTSTGFPITTLLQGTFRIAGGSL